MNNRNISDVVHIYYTKFTSPLDHHTFTHLARQLTLAMQDQLKRYRHWQDAHRSLLGKVLLITGLKMLEATSYKLSNLQYSAYQKPYFDRSLDFNISHSGNYVVCAISQTQMIGIDIEEIKPIPLVDFTDLFSAEELETILNTNDDFSPFYSLWTQKEAYLKAIGTGLNVPLNEISVNDHAIFHNGKTWFLKEVFLDNGYKCHLCTEKASPDVNIVNIGIDNLTV